MTSIVDGGFAQDDALVFGLAPSRYLRQVPHPRFARVRNDIPFNEEKSAFLTESLTRFGMTSLVDGGFALAKGTPLRMTPHVPRPDVRTKSLKHRERAALQGRVGDLLKMGFSPGGHGA